MPGGCGRRCPGRDKRGCGCAARPGACDAGRSAPLTRTAPVPDSLAGDNWPTAADSFAAAGSRARPAAVDSPAMTEPPLPLPEPPLPGPRSRPVTAAGNCPVVDSRPAIVDKRLPPVVVHSSASGVESWPAAADSPAAAVGNWLTVVANSQLMTAAAGSCPTAVDKPAA